MSCKPDIKKTEEMYGLYQQGFSLSEVGKAFGVSRQSVYKRFERRKLKLRTPIPLPFFMFQGKKFSLRANGYYGCTKGYDRRLLHIAVWEAMNGKIPKGHDIHHIDHDKSNNAIENLELYTKSEHARKFSTGNNQHKKKR